MTKNRIMLDNQSTVHRFSNNNLICDVRPSNNPVNMHSIGGVTHCSLKDTITDFGTAYYKEESLTNIFYMALIQDLYDISYQNAD